LVDLVTLQELAEGTFSLIGARPVSLLRIGSSLTIETIVPNGDRRHLCGDDEAAMTYTESSNMCTLCRRSVCRTIVHPG
jgi:hypothetical protein